MSYHLTVKDNKSGYETEGELPTGDRVAKLVTLLLMFNEGLDIHIVRKGKEDDKNGSEHGT